jgi:gluconate 2-dehydrogenase gamma chain
MQELAAAVGRRREPRRIGEDDMTRKAGVDRRNFLKTIGAGAATAAAGDALRATPAGAAETMSGMAGHGAAHAPSAEASLFFNGDEIGAISAIVDTLIPKDEVGPGGVDAGVVTFLDRDLAGAYGRGARLYLQGPFAVGTPEQGYQLPLTPAEIYRIGLADLQEWVAATHGGRRFEQLDPGERGAALKAVDGGKAEFRQIPAAVFFETLLGNVMEGYFADPAYGGNRDKAVWKMIGFPGAAGVYGELIASYRNRVYSVEPKSIADLS